MTTRQAESTIPTGTWQSDPVHSTVGFAVRHAVGTFRGSFGEFVATLSDGSGEPQLTGHVPVESVEVKDENLEANLLSPEFFDKDQAPEIRFESTKVDRHDYGLDWQMELPGGGKTLGDEVTLSVHLELIKEEA